VGGRTFSLTTRARRRCTTPFCPRTWGTREQQLSIFGSGIVGVERQSDGVTVGVLGLGLCKLTLYHSNWIGFQRTHRANCSYVAIKYKPNKQTNNKTNLCPGDHRNAPPRGLACKSGWPRQSRSGACQQGKTARDRNPCSHLQVRG
jgi:hypothetical protein